MSQTRVVIDTDPGIDDVVALALAAVSPELEVIAVTTTYGNVPLEKSTRNAHTVLRLMDRGDVPVIPGAARPLQRPLVTAEETHGESGIGYAKPGPVIDVTERPGALGELLAQENEPIVLVTLGPLTNLAHAIRLYPRAVRTNVARHIGMFGNINERGNTNRYADFNAWCDPEATRLVLAEEVPTEMVGLDVTRRMVVTTRETAWLESQERPALRWFGRALRFYVEFHRAHEKADGCVVNDVLTIGELLNPGMLTFADRRLDVGLEEGDERGRTSLCDEGFNVRAAERVDVETMRKLLDRVFSEEWRNPTEA